MPTIPTIDTVRLRLRAYAATDTKRIQSLCNDRDVASTTLTLPHPYEDGVAEEWIAKHAGWFERGEEIVWAITIREGGLLIGTVSLRLVEKHRHAEMGYLLGKDYWRSGYCTEAATAVVRHAFETLDLHRVFAFHFARNPASGRVMLKAGMTQEGVLRQHYLRWGKFEDCVQYAILRAEYISFTTK